MRVTLNTDYSLRVLMFVATKTGGLSTIQEISDSFGISRAHLMKVVHHLGLLGYITTIRGKNGGIKLLRDAADIRIGAVVRDTEDDLAVLGCMEDHSYCRIARACILRRAFHEATRAFLSTLDEYTLADLVKPRSALSKLLEIPQLPRPDTAAS